MPSAREAPPPGAARVAGVRGLLLAQAQDGRWLPVDPGTELPAGARLRTGMAEGSGARLALAGGGDALVGVGSEIVLAPDGPRRINGTLRVQGRGAAPAPVGGACQEAWVDALAKRLAADPRIPKLMADAAADGTRAALEMESLSLEVREDAGIAHASLDLVFRNRADGALEGTFFYVVPEGAVVTGFEMWNGASLVRGEVVEREKARQVFEHIKRQGRDPALLEWAGGNLFKMRVFPIPAKGVKRVRLTLAQALPADGVFRFPLVGEAFRSVPLASLRVHAASSAGVAQSPTHPLGKEGVFSGTAFVPDRDLEVRFPRRPAAVAMAGHRAEKDSPFAQEAGFFMMRLGVRGPAGAAQGALPVTPNVPVDAPLILLLDGTASMGEDGFTAARLAAEAVMEMNPGRKTRLAILGQGDPASAAPLALADIADLAALRQAAKARLPVGGNDFAGDFRRLGAALDQAGVGAAQIVYLGDGTPSLGERLPGDALARAAVRALASAGPEGGRRVSCVAVGAQADAAFLRQLARAGGGRCVKPPSAAETARSVAALFDPSPRLENLRVAVEGAPGLGALHGAQADELPAGGEMRLTGRLPLALDGQEAVVVVRGEWAGQPFEERHAVRLGLKAGTDHADLPRLWAADHLAWLAEERARGVSPRRDMPAAAYDAWCREETIATSVVHQIASPLTSYLVLESEEDYARHHIRRQTRRVDWNGEKLGLWQAPAATEKAEQAARMEEAGGPLRVAAPAAPAAVAVLPEALHPSGPMLDLLDRSPSPAPALRALWRGDTGAVEGGGGGTCLFEDSSAPKATPDAPPAAPSGGSACFTDDREGALSAQLAALESEEAPASPGRDAEGWEALASLVEARGWESAEAPGAAPKFLAPPGVFPQSGGPVFAEALAGWTHGTRVVSVSGSSAWEGIGRLRLNGVEVWPLATADTLPLARRAVRLHGGADPAGWSAKLALFGCLSANAARNAAQAEAWRAERAALVRGFQACAPDAASLAKLRLWEATLAPEEAVRHAIVWDLIAPGVGVKALADPAFVPQGVSVLPPAWCSDPTAAEAAIAFLEHGAGEQETAWAVALRLRLIADAARSPRKESSDFWSGFKSLPLDAATRRQVLVVALAGHLQDKAALDLAFDLATELKDAKAQAAVLAAQVALDPEFPLSDAGMRAFKEAGKEEEVWRRLEALLGDPDVHAAWLGEAVRLLQAWDAKRCEAFLLRLIPRAKAEAFERCNDPYLGWPWTPALGEAALVRLRDPALAPGTAACLWRFADHCPKEQVAFCRRLASVKRELLVPVLVREAASADRGDGSALLDLLWDELSMEERERLGAAFDGLALRWRLARLRAKDPAAFVAAETAGLRTAEDGWELHRLVQDDADFLKAVPPAKRVETTLALLEAIEAKEPGALWGANAWEVPSALFSSLCSDALAQGRVDLAEKTFALLRRIAPSALWRAAHARDLEELRTHWLRGDLAAAAQTARAAWAARGADKAKAQAELAGALARWRGALAKDPAPPDPGFSPDDGRTPAQRTELKEAFEKACLAHDARLKPYCDAAEAAAVELGLTATYQLHFRAVLAKLAGGDPQARALWLAVLAQEAKEEDPVRRENTALRLQWLAHFKEWAALREETRRLARAEPGDPLWLRWLAHACERSGDGAGALAALRELAAREPEEPEWAWRLFAAEAPELDGAEAAGRAKALPLGALDWESAKDFKAWLADRPQALAALEEREGAAQAAEVPPQAEAPWHAAFDGASDFHAAGEVRRLCGELGFEQAQTRIGAQVRAWEPDAATPPLKTLAISLVQAKLAEIQRREKDAQALLTRAADLFADPQVTVDLGSLGRLLVDHLVARGAVEQAVGLALAKAAQDKAQDRWAPLDHLVAWEHSARLSPEQEYRLLLAREQGGHPVSSLRMVKLLCEMKRPAEADVCAARFVESATLWELAQLRDLLRRQQVSAEKFQVAVAKRRQTLVAAFAAWAATDMDFAKAPPDWNGGFNAFDGIRQDFAAVLERHEAAADPEKLLRMGGAWRQLERNDRAVAVFRRVAASPAASLEQKVGAWEGLRGIFLHQEEWVLLLETLDALDRLDPGGADDRRLHRFRACWRLGRQAPADAAATAWLEASPLATPGERRRLTQWMLRAATVGLELDGDAGALSQTEATGRRYDDLAEVAEGCGAHLWHARALFARHAMAKALGEDALGRAVAAHAALARAYWHLNRPEEACQAACDGLALSAPALSLRENPGSLEAGEHEIDDGWGVWESSVAHLAAGGDGEKLADRLAQVERHFLTRILPERGDNPHIRLALARLHRQTGHPIRALPHGRALVALAPAEPLWRRLLIADALDADRPQEALDACRAWLAREPRSLAAHGLMASALERMLRLGDALAAHAGGADAQPLEAAGHLAYAEALVRRGRRDEAAWSFRRAMAARPTRHALVARAVGCCFVLQTEAKALFAAGLAACDRAIGEFPDDPQPWLDKARFLRSLDRSDEAYDLAEKIAARRWVRFEVETREEARNLLEGRGW